MISRLTRTLVAITITLFLVATLTFLHPPSRAAYIDPWTGEFFGEDGEENTMHILPYPGPSPHASGASETELGGGKEVGGVIMSKLGNETVKAELGRATWRLLHTMTLRYPENPTQDEREALETYMHLTSRLYPCGECAAEFQALLKLYPPQTASRLSASLWLCSLHNEVNTRLKKPQFDCANLDSEYDCGCGDDKATTSTTTTPAQPTSSGRDDTGNIPEPMDLEWDVPKDATGADLIKGGRR